MLDCDIGRERPFGRKHSKITLAYKLLDVFLISQDSKFQSALKVDNHMLDAFSQIGIADV